MFSGGTERTNDMKWVHKSKKFSSPITNFGTNAKQQQKTTTTATEKQTKTK